MKDRAMTEQPIDHDAILEGFAPAEPVDESKLPLSWWAVAACLLGVAAILLSAGAGGYLGLVAILGGVAARHDIQRGAKAGANWASSAIWFGGLALVLTILVRVLGS
jgi:hypothetical protein